MHRFLFVPVAFLLMPTLSSGADPIQNIIDTPVPIKANGNRYSIEEVRAAIILGCQDRTWTAEVSGGGVIRAKLNVKNKHFAEVEIPYSNSAYSIIYASSSNLDYNAKRQKIHGSYNKWVLQLSTAINKQFQLLNSILQLNELGRDRSSAEKENIFDELLKLDELRDRGLLTDEEFEVEKRKLLDRD